jgi:glutathione S-transferase
MSASYRIFGSDLSPYSVKVRSYFRYKQIPHSWIVRHTGTMAEFQRYAKLPLIPLVVAPDGTALQDSTPIIEHMERLFPQPALAPADPVSVFVSALVEEYADEWGNKPMFHYRWFYDADQASAADRIARDLLPGAPEDAIRATVANVRERMIPRLRFVGSSPANRDRIEGSFRRQLAILDRHLARRPYLFGGRPALADFGLFAQHYECSTDPTPAALMRDTTTHVLAWIERMLEPRAEGVFEPWADLEPTLSPLLAEEIAGLYFPWATANARALAEGAREFSVDLEGRAFVQETQKYHARSLAALRARYAAIDDRVALDQVLERTGCRRFLV